MSNKKISDLTTSTAVVTSNDLVEVSVYNGSTYDSRKVTTDKLHAYNTILLKVTQSGTSAPTVNYSFNDTTATITPSYTSVGSYKLTFSSGILTLNKDFITATLHNSIGFIFVYRISTTVLIIETFDITGASSNNLLDNGIINIKIAK
jgi:hypothetical protein